MLLNLIKREEKLEITVNIYRVYTMITMYTFWTTNVLLKRYRTMKMYN